jgi:hypothetical protein
MLKSQITLACLAATASIAAMPTVASSLTLTPVPDLGNKITTPVSVSTTMTTSTGNVSNLINDSGLSAPAVCDRAFEPFMNTTTHSGSPGSTGWRGGPTGVITFGFSDCPTPINAIGLWQGTDGGGIGATQLKDFNLYADNDGDFTNGYTSLFASFTALQTTSPNIGQVGYFGKITTPFVHLEIISNYGGSTTSVGEVIFASTPEPMTMLGAGAAAGLGAFFKRRAQKKA